MLNSWVAVQMLFACHSNFAHVSLKAMEATDTSSDTNQKMLERLGCVEVYICLRRMQ